jgi:hypothetical protein
MGVLRKASGGAIIAGAALLGNWLGDVLRAATTGESEHQLGLVHTSFEGQTVLGLNVALTNFLPALLLALLAGKPRTLYAFVSGAVISALVGDGFERALARWLRGDQIKASPR